MKVGIVAPPWVPVPPPGYGGTEAVIDSLATGVQAAGHDVVLFATGDSTADVRTLATFREALGPGPPGAQPEWHQSEDAYEALGGWAHVIHDHTLSGTQRAARAAVPCVTTLHGAWDDDLRAWYRDVGRRVGVVAISRRQAELAPEVPIADVIHHGVDVDALPMGDGDGGYALFLGRMAPEKGVHTAAAVARKAGVPLVIAAKMREPAERDYFRRAVEPLLAADIRYLGEADHGTKLELLRDASCLLNPIDWEEPFGMVMVEAMGCGTPVVATPRGSAPELVHDGVTGFVRASEDDLAEAVGRAATLDRTRIRKVAGERFSARRMVEDYIDLYGRVIDHHLI